MGYYSRVSGTLTFEPELTFDQLVQLDEEFEGTSLHYGGDFDVTKWRGDPDELFKAYDIKTSVEALVRRLEDFTVKATGAVQVVGEESGDVWRLVVNGPTVTVEHAKLVWPDNTPVKLY